MAGRNPSPSACWRCGCLSSMRVHVLSLSLFRKGGGSALTPPPTKTEVRPSSWSPSLLAPTSAFLSSSVRTKPSGVVLPPAWLRDPEAILLGAIPGERLDPEATHSPPGVLAYLVHLRRKEMGWPISCLDSMSCLPSSWAQVLVPLSLYQGNPMFHCCDCSLRA